MKIVSADYSNIDKLAVFAREVFIDYYEDLIGIDQCEYMVELFLSDKAITKLIEDGAIYTRDAL